MYRFILVGSPRIDGRSASLADLLFEACIDEYPDEEVMLAPISTLSVAPCQGCDACRGFAQAAASKAGEAADEADAAEGTDELADEASPLCIIEDDMQEIYEHLLAADELTVVCPVYFAGAPAQFKALLDRLQTFFWHPELREGPKRPAILHVVGEGGDPHGFEPLIGTVKSALSVAGFKLETVFDWVGKIDDDGEITAEATPYSLDAPQKQQRQAVAFEELAGNRAAAAQGGASDASKASGGRPRLDLSAGGKSGSGKSTQREAGGAKGSSKSRGNAGRTKGGQGKRSGSKPGSCGSKKGKGGRRG